MRNHVESHSTGVETIADQFEGKQYLTFRLLEQEFGVDILRVQEIKNFSYITPIPNTPPSVKGAMNLRGTVVPIIDLRIKFGMPDVHYDQYTVIIVVNVGQRVVGLVVDAVSDVLNVGAEDFEPAPDFGQEVDTAFITGLAKSENRLTTLLDLEQLIGHEEANAS